VPGATQLTAGSIRRATQAGDESITLGTYVEQVLSYADRVFLTVGGRYDGNSAFGSDFSGVLYPKVGLSWVVSDEGFFPELGFVNSLRLRGTYGSSGVQPGTTDALRFFEAVNTTLTGGVEAPGVTISALGNKNLKPEYSGEFETGFDGTFFGERSTVELTYYNKTTRDAIIQRRIAPSLAGVTSNFENIGSIRNQGMELSFNQKIVDRAGVGLDLNLTGSTNKNRILSLGEGGGAALDRQPQHAVQRPGLPAVRDVGAAVHVQRRQR
jgi:outer membrane receptor protein involved in Fe transport